MSDEKKRLADALAAMAAGQHDEADHDNDTSGHTDTSATPVDTEHAYAATESAGTSQTSSTTSGRPTSPDDPALVAKIRAKPRPTTPAAPATPVAWSSERAPDRPPEPVTHPATSVRPSSPGSGFSESLERPATPGFTAAAPRRRVVRKSKPVFASLAFRRTIIPVCLVLGIGMPLMAALWLTLDEDHPARKISILLPMVFVVVGLGVLALGVMTMLQVRSELANREQQRGV